MEKAREDTKVLLGRRIRALRTYKGWTQMELGHRANISYKFLGEIERGQQNPSFDILVKLAEALDVGMTELFRYEQEVIDIKQVETQIKQTLKSIPENDIRKVLLVLRTLYPF